jgi:CarD family transcriptional regulator
MNPQGSFCWKEWTVKRVTKAKKSPMKKAVAVARKGSPAAKKSPAAGHKKTHAAAKARPSKSKASAEQALKKPTPAKKLPVGKAAKKAAPQKKVEHARKAVPEKKTAHKAQPAHKPEPKKPELVRKPELVKKSEFVKKPESLKKPELVKKPEPAKIVLIDFAAGDYVVYPTHGVGRVDAIEQQTIAGYELRLIVIRFDKEKMTLRVPIEKAKASGLRKLSSQQQMSIALTTLKGRSRTSRAMWSRRAQEYEAKINSGDPVAIAEVLRDLHRNAGQPDQSYSERQIYEAALDRLARELAAVEKIDRDAATQRLEDMLKAA